MYKPIVNILTRTSNRPKYFQKCYDSIKNQTYSNINHIISVDDDESEEYVKKITNNYIRVGLNMDYSQTSTYNYVKRITNNYIRVGLNVDYSQISTYNRKFAKYNLYLNDLKNTITDGWIMFLDDDDILLSDTAIEDIINKLVDKDYLILWRVQFPNLIIPSDEIFKLHTISLYNFSMIGFMYHSKYNNLVMFDGLTCGDFYYVNQLAPKIPKSLWIDNIYTGIQRTNDMGGFGKKDDLK